MTTALFKVPDVTTELQRFEIQTADIAEMAKQYLPLKINGVEDKAGAEAVHKGRMTVVKARTSTEKTRKALKAEALEYGRRVDAEASRIFKLIEPIEEHLKFEELRIEQEVEAIRNAARIKEEAERRAAEEAERSRVKAEQEARAAELRRQKAELAKARAEMEAERRKAEAEAKARQDAENARLAAERAAIEESRRKLQDAQRASELEAKRIADAEAARLRKIEEDRLAAERAERQRAEAEERKAREAEAAEAARIRAEALRPDAEKLLAVASIVAGISVPQMDSDESLEAAAKISMILDKAAADIRDVALSLAPMPASPDVLPPAEENEEGDLPW